MYSSMLSPPPRKVSFSIWLKFLFSGFIRQFFWIFFIFGLFFCLGFNVKSVISGMYHFSGEIITTEGISTGYSQTNSSINDEYVFKTNFVFKDINGKTRSGSSYLTGEYIPRGEAVSVEFKGNNPKYSRIEGARYSAMGWGILFVLIFPLIGFCGIIASFYLGIKNIYLLKNGLPASGHLISSSFTGTTVNDIPLMKMEFEYRDLNGITHKTHSKTLNPEILEDDESEALLYDPKNPSKSLFIDTIDSGVYVDESGNFKTAFSFKSLLSLILPCIGTFLFILLFLL